MPFYQEACPKFSVLEVMEVHTFCSVGNYALRWVPHKYARNTRTSNRHLSFIACILFIIKFNFFFIFQELKPFNATKSALTLRHKNH